MESLAVILSGLFFIFLGGFITGISGIGFALATVPFMTLFLPPDIVVPVIVIFGFGGAAILLAGVWKTVELRRTLPLVLSGIAGVPFGTLLLKKMDGNLLKLFIGILVIAAGAALLKNVRLKIRKEKLAAIPVGLVSGVLHGCTSIGGPPVILFYANQRIPKERFRANVVAYFFFLQSVTFPVFLSTGLITSRVMGLSAWYLPGLLTGLWMGKRLHMRVNETFFRIFVLCIVMAGGVFAVASSLIGLNLFG